MLDLVTGDFSGTGLPDIVTVADPDFQGPTRVTGALYPNLGGGTFGPPREVVLPSSPQRVAMADFNNDGLLDLATSDSSAYVDIAFGHGDGTFEPSIAYLLPVGDASSIIASDLDRDGDVDLTLMSYSAGALFLDNLGGGVFSEAIPPQSHSMTALSLGDLDNDGYPDLAFGDIYLRGIGVKMSQAGRFPTTWVEYETATAVHSIAIGDFNGDGWADLVAASARSLSVFLNKGDGTFARDLTRPMTSVANDMAVGDFDRDGLLDLAVAMSQGVIQVLPGLGDGRFGATLTFEDFRDPLENFLGSIEAVDLTGSGRLDLVYRRHYQGVGVLLNTSPSGLEGALGFASATYAAVEGGGTASIKVVRTGGSVGAVGVRYATSAGTAVSGRNYLDVSGTLLFADGEMEKTFEVPILDDPGAFSAVSLSVNLTLSMTTGGAVVGSPASSLLMIFDDTTRHLSIGDVTVDEDAGMAYFTVTTDFPVGPPITARVATTDGTARAGVDYADTSMTLTLETGSTSRTFGVPILANPLTKRDGTFFVALTEVMNAGVSRGIATATILDKNAPLVAQAATISAVQNVPFAATLGSFTDPNGTEEVEAYSATIDWGDGSAPEAGTVVRGGNTFSVVGSHLYAKAGLRGIKVSVARRGNDPDLIFSRAVVEPNAIIAQFAGGVASVAGALLQDVVVATFVDRGGVGAAGSYLADIDWGDGSPSVVGRLSALPAIRPTENPRSGDYGVYAVWGTHSYAAPGEYRVVVTIRGQNGAVAGADGVVAVREAPPVVIPDGPRIAGLAFDRSRGRVTVVLKGTEADLDLAAVANPANFRLTRRGTPARRFVVTGVLVGPPSADGSRALTLLINGGRRRLPVGTYLFRAFAGGISDRRGLRLDGEFSGSLPSGDGTEGGDFAARMVAYRRFVGAPTPVEGRRGVRD